MPAAPVTMPTDPVAATRRKLARLLAVGAMRAAAGKDPEAPLVHDEARETPEDEGGLDCPGQNLRE